MQQQSQQRNSYSKKIGPYYLTKEIGSGSYGKVYIGTRENTNQQVAIKMLPKHSNQDSTEREIEILKQLDHPNIIKLLDLKRTNNNNYLVFEYCDRGDLEKFQKEYFQQTVNGKQSSRIPEETVQQIVYQIAEAFKELRNKGIVHRDLKLQNILITGDFKVKLADFGFAKQEQDIYKTHAGTPLTMAPEILEGKSYTEKCDLWSLGIIIFQMLTGDIPFNLRQKNVFEIQRCMKENDFKRFPEDLQVSNLLKDLISRMLIYDEKKRISFEEFFNNPWVQQGRQDNLDQSHLQQSLCLAYNKNQKNKKPAQQYLQLEQKNEQSDVNKLMKQQQVSKQLIEKYIHFKFVEFCFDKVMMFTNQLSKFQETIEKLLCTNSSEQDKQESQQQADTNLINGITLFDSQKDLAQECAFLLIILIIQKIQNLYQLKSNFKYNEKQQQSFILTKIFYQDDIASEQKDILQDIKIKLENFLKKLDCFGNEFIQRYEGSNFSCEEMLYQKVLEYSESIISNETQQDYAILKEQYRILVQICNLFRVVEFPSLVEIKIKQKVINNEELQNLIDNLDLVKRIDENMNKDLAKEKLPLNTLQQKFQNVEQYVSVDLSESDTLQQSFQKEYKEDLDLLQNIYVKRLKDLDEQQGDPNNINKTNNQQ